MSTVLVGGVA